MWFYKHCVKPQSPLRAPRFTRVSTRLALSYCSWCLPPLLWRVFVSWAPDLAPCVPRIILSWSSDIAPCTARIVFVWFQLRDKIDITLFVLTWNLYLFTPRFLLLISSFILFLSFSSSLGRHFAISKKESVRQALHGGRNRFLLIA